jgi:predicted metalloprotease with PDZ domain
MEQTQRLFMAENSPGGLREVYARFVEVLRVEAESGHPLPVHRVAPSTWAIDTEPGRCVTVTYLVHQHLDDEVRLVSNAIESGRAYYVGATILLGLEERTTEPATLSLEPSLGSSVWTTLSAQGPATFRASSYQELAWAPVLIGSARPLDIALADGVLRFVSFGAPSDSVLEPIATRFGEIARCQEEVFGFLPERLILVGLRWREDLDYGGGVSRRNAVVMNIGREWMPEPGRFASATFAHELFHTWNFGLFYPAESRPWQPFGSTATRAFWLVEGLTNYYVLQTFVRLGRMDAQRALDWIGSEITNFETSPARAWASLEDGGPMADAGAVNGIDVRAGGFVVGFVLDAMIRRDSEGRSNLDDVVRALAVPARQSHYAGYQVDDLIHVVRSVGGDSVAAAYLRLTSRPSPLDYNELLDGTGYGVETVADSTVVGGRRWQVVQSQATDLVTTNSGVLATGCARAQ